ncbi:uncharacterized protein LOC107041367 [Diachasma alloeum]|uniref:uncharacterized protein LOC107041367 n=1 Tax=Diachasma alloeum TaxID=454923 RepID=UPI0007383DFC|nr:uncharacterized protein LOC107041367 [Diachasma alloeum]
MTGRVSLVEQKRLQWAKEREEMARLSAHWESTKNSTPARTTIRTRLSSRESGVTRKPLRASGHYGSTASLRALETGSTSLQSLDFSTGGSMINILERAELQGPLRKRSPSLPPIYTKEPQPHHPVYSTQGQNKNQIKDHRDKDKDHKGQIKGHESPNKGNKGQVKGYTIKTHKGLEVEGSRYANYPRQKHPPVESERNPLQGSTYEEREGETSGYASDSIEPPRGCHMTDGKRLLPLDKSLVDNQASGRLWPNPYSETSDGSLPSSRRFSTTRLNELNRPRWESVWNRDNHHPDPPPPSWLERGLSRMDHSSQKHPPVESERNPLQGSTYEEREGETSGYASDSIEPPRGCHMTDGKRLLPLDKSLVDNQASGRLWPNPYSETSDGSLPSSRRFSTTRLNELNRPRWESVWNRDNHHPDPPPPSWLERGLSRMDHSSQILVINHDSASSPDSSTTGSTGSDSKTYLRGQNIPVDAHILQEREAKRQKALELQNAIKQQLEEKDRKRREEREQKLREEREEEERIKRERNKEKERFEEEQRRLKDKEDAKLKKEVAMREILETAERIAREEKRQKRQRDDSSDVGRFNAPETRETINTNELSTSNQQIAQSETNVCVENPSGESANEEKAAEKSEKIGEEIKESHLRLPVNKEVAIVLTGRLEDSEFLSGSNLQLLNLIVNSTPRETNHSGGLKAGISAIVKTLGSPKLEKSEMGTMCSPRFRENRLLTPSKYRGLSGRDFGTQTDGENEGEGEGKDGCKERKEVLNSRRDIDKSTNTGSTDDKNSRSKSQPRASIDARPRWNANRPGTRYRTQSEKDPHYQRRLRLRRRRVESSDERSRSPSPNRRKSTNQKSKPRNSTRRKVKLEHYDADLSMDSLNSVVPLRITEHGRIQLMDDKVVTSAGDSRNEDDKLEPTRKLDLWCGEQILSQLTALRNGLLFKQQEWDTERCLVSPNTDYY